MVGVSGACNVADEQENALDEVSGAQQKGYVAYDDPCSGIYLPDQPPFKKKIALTFDDGPNLEKTPKVVQILRAHSIPATFFVVGHRIDKGADLIRELDSDPLFSLANHSYSHSNFREINTDGRKKQLIDTTKLLLNLNVDTKFFRFPFGSADCEIRDEVSALGYMPVGWHIDSGDWCFEMGGGSCTRAVYGQYMQREYIPKEYETSMSDWIIHQAEQLGGGIVLMHDTLSVTLTYLEPLINGLQARGFEFIAINSEDVFPQLNEAVATAAPTTPIVQPTPSPSQEEQCIYVSEYVTSSLNVRASPVSGAVVGRLNKGDTAHYLAKSSTNDGWHQIRTLGGAAGWVYDGGAEQWITIGACR
jgi:peptidoglycan/xylan/chitin deacetylase (PgdA/CDA1 family)